MVAIVAGQGLGLFNTSAGVLGGGGQVGVGEQGRSGEKVAVNASTGNLVIQQQDEWLVGLGPDVGIFRTYNSLLNAAGGDGDNNDNWRLGFSRKIYGLTGTLNAAGSTVKRVGEDGVELTYSWDSTRSAYVNKDGGGSFDTLVLSTATTPNTWVWTDGDTQIKETYELTNTTTREARLKSVTDLDGKSLTLSYNGNGLVSQILDASGESVFIDYDATAGKTANITQIRTVKSGAATHTRVRYGYDSANRLSTVTVDLSPQDNSIADGKTYVTTYAYTDATGKRIASIGQSDGSKLEFEYDGSGRILKVKDNRGASDIRITSFDYSVANTTKVTDPLGQITEIGYDASTLQLKSVKMPAVGTATAQLTQYEYDGSGNLSKVIDARNNETVYGYDARGNRTYERDASGIVIERSYSTAGQLLSETRYTTPDPDAGGSGLPSGAQTTRYVYDTKNHLRFVLSAEGRLTEHQYNSQGQRTTTLQYTGSAYTASAQPSGSELVTWASQNKAQLQRTDYSYDFRGQLSEVKTYETLGTDGVGLEENVQTRQTYVYDASGNLLSRYDGLGTTSYLYDGLNRITSRTDGHDVNTLTMYDDAQRQTKVTLVNGLVTVSSYDQGGRLIKVEQQDSTQGNLVLGATTYAYDKLGRLRQVTDPTGVNSYLLYDAASRKVADIDGEGALTEYFYNAANQVTGTRQYANKVSAGILAALALDHSNASLPITSLDNGLAGWSMGVDGVATNFLSGNNHSAAWRLTDDNTLWIKQTGAEAISSYLQTASLAVTAGQRYEVSAYTGAHRAKATLKIAFYDAQGNKIEPTLVPAGGDTVNNAEKNGGPNLAGYKRLWGFVTAPTGAVSARVLVAKDPTFAGQNDSYLFATHLSLSQATADQMTASPVNIRPPLDAANDRVTRQLYDQAGRLAKTIDGVGAVKEYRYDGAGRLIETLAHNNLLSTTQLANLAASTGEILPTNANTVPAAGNTRQERQFYSADGLLLGELEGGSYTEHTYDAAGRLASSTRYANHLSGVVADGGSKPPVVTASQSGPYVLADDTRDQKTQYVYDASGLLVGVVDAEGYLTYYEYNEAGKKTDEYRFATTVKGTFDGKTLPSFLQATDTAPSTGSYVRMDPVRDQGTSFDYDALGRLQDTYRTPDGLIVQYVYDDVGNLVQMVQATSNSDLRQTFKRYDVQGRLTAELSAQGGRALLDWQLANPDATEEQLDTQTELIWTQYGTRHEYDKAGRRIATTVPDGNGGAGHKTLFYYNQVNRLTHSLNALGELTQYAYNAFGQSTQQTVYAKAAGLTGLSGGLNTATALTTAIAALSASASSNTVTKTAYNRRGEVTTLTDALGNQSTRTYTAYGQLATSQNGTLTTRYYYDARGDLSSARDLNASQAVLRVMSTTPDAFGREMSGLSLDGWQSVTTYDKLGRVLTITDGTGAVRSYTYDAFGQVLTYKDGQGKTTNYAYDRAARTMTVTTPEGVQIITERNAHGEVVKVTDGRSHTTEYQYGGDGQLTSTKVFAQGNGTALTQSQIEYDKAGRVFKSTDGRGTVTQTTYDAASRVTKRVVDPTGLNLDTEHVYDAKGQVGWTKDANGIWTQSEYDVKGQLKALTIDPRSIPDATGYSKPLVANASGANLRTEYTYDTVGRTVTIAQGVDTTQAVGSVARYATAQITRYGYDDLGQRISETVDPKRSPVWTSGADDRAAGLNLTTSYTYDMRGNAVSRTDALSQVTRYVYDAQKRQTYVVDATGAVVKNEYDGEGRLSRSIAYGKRIELGATTVNGVASAALSNSISETQITERLTVDSAVDQAQRYTYDGDGRLVYSVDALNRATKREYDKSGNVVKLTRLATAVDVGWQTVNGRVTVTVYDAVSHADDRIEQTTYDAAGRAIWSVDALKGVTQRRFDANGNVIETKRYANLMTGTLAANGTPAVVADAAKDRLTRTVYDRANRAIFSVEAANSTDSLVTRTTYDKLGRVKSNTRFAGLLKNTLVDNVAPQVIAIGGQVPTAGGASYVQEAAADATTKYDYDGAGRLIKTTDAEGAVTARTYDAASRLTNLIEGQGSTAESRTLYTLDTAGRIKQETRGYGSDEASTTRYVQDALGQRKEIIDPRGIELAETDSAWAMAYRKGLGGAYLNASGEAKAWNELTAAQRETLRQLYTTKQEFDAAGRVTKSTDPLGGITKTDYDAFGNAVKVTAPNDSVGYFFFDRNNQATWHIDPMGYGTQTSYDAFGSVSEITRFDAKVSGTIVLGTGPAVYADQAAATTANATFYQLKTSGKDATTQIQHDKLGRQTKIIDAENKAEETAYDALGNKKSFTNKLGGLYTYTHDRLGRVLTEKQPVQVKELLADGSIKLVNGLAVMKDVTTQFTYDSRGNILTKTEGLGLVAQQRITTYGYDKLDRLKTTTGEAMTTYTVADGEKAETPVETRWYDARGNLTEVEAADKGRTLTYWDALNRKTAEVSPTGTLTQWDYADDGKVVAQRIYGDAVTVAAGTRGGVRPSPVSATNVRETLFTYNANSQLTKTTAKNITTGSRIEGGGYSVTTGDVNTLREYDKVGNVVKETDGRGYETFSYYDKAGNRILQVDAERYVTAWDYDEAGNLIRQTRYANALPAATVVSVDSTRDALIAAVPTATDKRVVEYDYDRLNRKTQERVLGVAYVQVDASNGKKVDKNETVTTMYEYNALGAVTKKTNGANEVTDYSYDKQGRLSKTEAPLFTDFEGSLARPTSELEYNGLGLMSRAIQRGKDNAVETDDRITRYTYGKNGLRTSEIDAMGYVTAYAYDAAGRVTRTRSDRKDADGAVNNDQILARYDLAGQQIEQITQSKLASEGIYRQLTSLQFSYGVYGQIVAKGENNGDQQMVEYDSAGRVWRTNAGTENGAVKVYYYDANGNATLELSSAIEDLVSSSVLADSLASGLASLLSGSDVQPTLNVYDKLNRLVDSFEPRMEGLTQDAVVSASLETITTTTPQDPFVAGNIQAFNTVFLPTSSSRHTRKSSSYDLSYAFNVNLPAQTVYGSNSYRVKNTVTVRSYASGWTPEIKSVTKVVEKYFGAGVASLSNDLIGAIPLTAAPGDSQVHYDYNAITEIYQVTAYGDVLVLSMTDYKPRPFLGYGNETGIYPVVPNTKYVTAMPSRKISLDGLPSNAASVNVTVKKEGLTEWVVLPVELMMINSSSVGGVFLANWSSLADGTYDYKFEAKDSAGLKVSGASGKIYLGNSPEIISKHADARPDLVVSTYINYLNWMLGAATSFEMNVHRTQFFNAYGEQIRQIRYKRDANNNLVEVATEFSYNALGNLIKKQDPSVSITLENGFQKNIRPATDYYYDAAGRLVGTSDANGNVTTFAVLPGSTPQQTIYANEFHANIERVEVNGVWVARQGVKRSYYDVFGQLRRSANELWDGVASVDPYATRYSYNANGQLTAIDRPGAADEDYEYDSDGNRIATTLAPDANNVRHRLRTNYDAMGRVTGTFTAFGRSTTYNYEWVATIAGGGGWRLTTTTANGTLIDDTDTFGRIRWHKDLGDRAFTYRYNNAGLLSGQTSLSADGTPTGITATLNYTGQDISFSHYGNGLLKDTVDNARQTWTKYRYNDDGQRVFEGYARNLGTTANPSWEYYQYSEASYDDAGRLVRVWDPKSDINYEYDAVGNRRRVLSKYHDGAQGGLQTQDYWYKYDNMNRFTVTMGSLSSVNNARAQTEADASITLGRGTAGRVIGYDRASQRTTAVTDKGTESYTYDAEGFLEEVKLNGSRIAWRDNDARGNVMAMEEKSSEGVTRHTYTYDADNNVKTDKEQFQATGGSYKLIADTTNTLMASGALDLSIRKEYKDDGTTVNNTVTSDYDYVYWDDAKQSQISIRASNPKVTRYWEPGATTLSYDINGHIERSTDLAGNRHFYYSTDADGRVIRREEIDGPDKKPSKQNRVAAERSNLFYQNYYFFNGREVGTVSNDPNAGIRDYGQALAQAKQGAYYKRTAVVSADFDQNYQPIGTNYPGRTSASYTVNRTGETLQNIALAVWGDSSLWYLIADANGLNGSEPLSKGQLLVIPNKVTNIHNNTQTSRPYDASQALGDISPTLPDPPPPKKKCGGLGGLLIMVIATVVAAITQQWWMMQLGKPLGMAAAAATGSIVSQGVGVVTGLTDEFSWKAVGLAAISAGVMKGMEGSALSKALTFSSGLGTTVAHGMAANAMTQGIAVAVGLQEKFDWRGVAAAGAGAAASFAVNNLVGSLQYGSDWDNRLGSVKPQALIADDLARGFVRSAAASFAGGTARSVVRGQRPDWGAIALDSFGSALGDSIVGSIVQREQAALESKHPVVGADEKAQILSGFADGPMGPRADERASGIGIWNSDQARELGLTMSDAGDGYYGDLNGRQLAANGRATRLIRMPDGRQMTAAQALESLKGVGNSLIHTAEEGMKAIATGMASDPQLAIASAVSPSSAETQRTLLDGANDFGLPRFGYDSSDPSGPAMEFVTDTIQTGLAVNGLVRGGLSIGGLLKTELSSLSLSKLFNQSVSPSEARLLLNGAEGLKVDLFGGAKSQLPSAINVDIDASIGVRADITHGLGFIPDGSVKQLTAFNPFIPERGSMFSADVFGEASRVLNQGGEMVVAATKGNSYVKLNKLPSIADFEKMGFEVVNYKTPLTQIENYASKFGSVKFSQSGGAGYINPNDMTALVLRKR